jgi:putative heme degradation protein
MAKKTATNELLSKLGQAMEEPTSQASDRSAGNLVQALEKKTPARAGKITATIYPTDWQRLDEIKDFFRLRGYRNLSDSEALRIACRAVRIGDELLPFYEDMKREDGRQKRTA